MLMHGTHWMDCRFFFLFVCDDDDAYDGRIRVTMRVGVGDDEDIIYRGGSAPHSFVHSRIERDGFVLAGRDGTGRAGRGLLDTDDDDGNDDD